MRRFGLSALATVAMALLVGCVSSVPVEVTPVAEQPPIIVPADQDLAAIQFTEAAFGLRQGDIVGEYVYGIVSLLVECNGGGNIAWGSKRLDVSERELASRFYEVAKGANLNVVGDPDRLFMRVEAPNTKKPDYLIGARIDNLKMRICVHNGGGAFGQTGEASLRVSWQVFDVLKKQLAYETETKGYYKLRDAVSNGVLRMFYEAFASAARNLAANPGFIAGLALPVTTAADIRNIDQARLAVPRAKLLTSPITENIDTIRLGVVTLETALGQGSGFFVAPNLILTNNHVVEGQKFVRVRLVTGRVMLGEVVRSHAQRDVALIQVEEPGVPPLSLRLEPVKIAEEIYAIGSPLAQEFAGTVSKGIVSKFGPNRYGLEDIQADVDIHGGNSGGALLDAQGNVVGVTYAGLSNTGSPTSIGINFFIPIADALQKLNIGFEQPTAAR